MNAAQRKARAMAEAQHIFDHAEMLLRESPGPLPAGFAQAVERAWRNRLRPYFDDPADYAAYCGDCWAQGKTPFEPESVEQLVAVNDAFPDETAPALSSRREDVAVDGIAG